MLWQPDCRETWDFFVNCASKRVRGNLTVRYSQDTGAACQKVWEVDPVGGYADLVVYEGCPAIFYERYSSESRLVEKLVPKVSTPMAECMAL